MGWTELHISRVCDCLYLREGEDSASRCIAIWDDGDGRLTCDLELEAHARGRIDIVAGEVAVREPAIYLREHEADISVELVGKLPIENGGRGVKRVWCRSNKQTTTSARDLIKQKYNVDEDA